jgi:predicted ATPase
MDGKRLIEKIRLRNILSFGDKGEEITLEPLNIIIGQNASGKSNLVDVIKLLRSLTQDKGLSDFIGKSGGITEWVWKGKKSVDFSAVVLEANDRKGNFEYEIQFSEDLIFGGMEILNENFKFPMLENFIDRKDIINIKDLTNKITDEESIIGKFYDVALDGKTYSIFNFRFYFAKTKIYSDLQTNRNAEIRKSQIPDAPNDFLEEDASNLALVLNDLEHRGDTKDKIVENLKKFNPRIKDYSVRISGGTVQLFIREEGLEKPISAMRLSEGTLRYLCLLVILCHPEPPPLICIEEPETGLHPDILPTIAELMIEASQRTQLIVTTHSDILVSAFSEVPEAVLVCEKDKDGTHFKRLEAEKLKVWLEEYELGEVWLRGEIGGTRW